MTLWQRILSAVSPPVASARLETGAIGSVLLQPEAGSGVTGRPAPRPYTETERKLIALSIGRATHGSFG